MAYASKLYHNEPIIHDTSSMDEVLPAGVSRGLELYRRATPYGAIPQAPPFPSELLIPESEFEARIKEKEQRKDRISDISLAEGLPCKDQNGTNYCWINGPTHCCEIVRLLQNQEIVILSPASVGAKIKNFRNEGGWGEEGLAYIASAGVVPVSLWPANAIERRYDTSDAWREAKRYRVTEWMELRPRNMVELASCLLRNIPVAVGYNWWSHEVSAVDAVWLDGELAIRIRNSWGMSWGSNGFGILQGRKAQADDQVAPRVIMA